MGLIDKKNHVIDHQRYYQNAFQAHTRLWRINPRSRIYLVPFQVLVWGSLGATLYAAGRKVCGYNTWFSKN
ncbi:bacteriophage N adsorption protein A c-term domain-containing protein [Ophiocordyceps camponoti-floridani]|uniref:Bacteriophage N adsorption protein A c-term domain-containing protein n=1 Tax=Ophiocordyceps camponoti-floridani TaxID=2030778 RepID=A0A8H4Q2I8_9HYPO|nr:bacteriophage N adsorption protein A c-term domain-containing protein [Ophiocordyceps camponoti-floridani]